MGISNVMKVNLIGCVNSVNSFSLSAMQHRGGPIVNASALSGVIDAAEARKVS